MMKQERDEIMERIRAVKALASNAHDPEGIELEGFMAIFHPKLSEDREYMRKLKQGRRRGTK